MLYLESFEATGSACELCQEEVGNRSLYVFFHCVFRMQVNHSKSVEAF